MILNFIGSMCFFSVYLIWLAFSLLLALIGFAIPINAKDLEAESVKESQTICRALFEKEKLTEEEYAFETNQVAISYTDLVFKGYGFIVAPVIWTLKRCNFIDSAVLFFVYRWMNVHHHHLQTENKTQIKVPRYHFWLTHCCVAIAKGTGKSLSLFD